VRLRRDFPSILALIRAHALLHLANRPRDDQGRVVAVLEDYAAVRAVVAGVLGNAVEVTVPQAVRETVEALRALDGEVSVSDLARKMGLDKGTVSRRVAQAIKAGFLVNHENVTGRPARLMPSDPMPEDLDILPSLEVLQRCSVGAGDPPPSPNAPQADLTCDPSASARDCSVTSDLVDSRQEEPE